MARLNRLVIPGHPHLLLQRARAGSQVYRDEQDVRILSEVLHDALAAGDLELHAHVVLPERWMLLVTPRSAQAISALMQGVGRRYVRHINQRHGLQGGMWVSRFCSTVIDAPVWTLPCMAFLDLAPVRAGLVKEPGEHHHGSHGHYVGLHHDRSLVAPSAVWNLGNTPFAREAAYAEMVHRGLSTDRLHAIEHALQRGWALGDPVFIRQLQPQTERRLEPKPRGRPAGGKVSRSA
ncbi:MAG: transposase [Hydrogenophaga sp.]|jgi:putative transposase|nr:transposase [Hydrogenophaga sp.]